MVVQEDSMGSPGEQVRNRREDYGVGVRVTLLKVNDTKDFSEHTRCEESK